MMSLFTLCGRLHGKSVAFAATSLGIYLINPVFAFYYVKIYLNEFHVSESWFQIAQSIVMLCNTISNPLFGYLQDNACFLPAIIRGKRHCILYAGPLYALSFIAAWYPWSDYNVPEGAPPWLAGLQLIFTLCLYDALHTFVAFAQGALMAEMVTEQIDRVRLLRYSKVACLIGSLSVFTCDFASSGLADFDKFHVVCIGLGTAAAMCFVYTGLYAVTKFDREAIVGSFEKKTPQVISSDGTECCGSLGVVLKQAFQIFRQRSFVSFVLINLCQHYHLHFLIDFSNIIGEQLIGNSMSSLSKSLLYGTMFTLPPLLVVVGAPIVSRVGYYKVIRTSFLFKIVYGLLFLAVGHKHPWITAAFFVIEYANVYGAFSLFGLCLSDVIDVDLERYQRGLPLSSMVCGLNALVTKPANAIAPMVTVALLSRYGYSGMVNKAASLSNAVIYTTTVASTQTESSELTAVMFYTTCFVPIIVGLMQLVFWRFYTIRDTHKCTGYKMAPNN